MLDLAEHGRSCGLLDLSLRAQGAELHCWPQESAQVHRRLRIVGDVQRREQEGRGGRAREWGGKRKEEETGNDEATEYQMTLVSLLGGMVENSRGHGSWTWSDLLSSTSIIGLRRRYKVD